MKKNGSLRRNSHSTSTEDGSDRRGIHIRQCRRSDHRGAERAYVGKNPENA